MMIRRRGSVCRLLLAATLLYGSGAHWLLMQGSAWANMLAARARRGSIAEAVATTFDGRHPCRVCLAVRRGAGGPAPLGFTRPSPSVDFAFSAGPASIPAASVLLPSSSAPQISDSIPHAPPLPPPKTIQVA